MSQPVLALWFGAKRRIASEIVAELGQHVAYWEPFCGSMAVLLAKRRSEGETVNDLNGFLINMARAIAHPTMGPRLYRRLRRTPFSEELFWHHRKTLIAAGEPSCDSEPDEEAAYSYFVVCWMGISGFQGLRNHNGGFGVEWSNTFIGQVDRWNSAISAITMLRRRLRDVTILRRDAFEIIGNIRDQTGTAIYCDPPYVVEGGAYMHTEVDNAKRLDWSRRLAALLSRFRRARVIVSEFDWPIVREMYRGWTIVELFRSRGHAYKTDLSSRSREILAINGPSLAGHGLFSERT